MGGEVKQTQSGCTCGSSCPFSPQGDAGLSPAAVGLLTGYQRVSKHSNQGSRVGAGPVFWCGSGAEPHGAGLRSAAGQGGELQQGQEAGRFGAPQNPVVQPPPRVTRTHTPTRTRGRLLPPGGQGRRRAPTICQRGWRAKMADGQRWGEWETTH